MNQLLLQLLLAHIIGDFLIQPKKWVESKQKHAVRSRYLYLHLLVHLLALLATLQFQIGQYWQVIVIIIITHYAIDLSKIYLQRHVNRVLLFALDQLAHLVVILLICHAYDPFDIGGLNISQPQLLLTLIALLCLTSVASIIIKVITSQWKFKEKKSLKGAGAYIGMLERLFVFLFIIYDQWEAIGFLITAKSVFRFGDLSKAKDRKLTEYILIGTLLSFALAVIIGLTYLYLLQQI
ncbi:DUF3307 domain-containing protein [Marinoscillum sp.]|uniref:DUF3307 domain-containing protein n=1 Tax=Marinoscillum sp. TaxID=2024838 RepID=UPI003BA8BC8C